MRLPTGEELVREARFVGVAASFNSDSLFDELR
jgi:hypothetical protein